MSDAAWSAFWSNLPALITALAVGVPGIIAAIYAKRSIKVTEEGNKVAAQAVVEAKGAQDAAKTAQVELGKKMKDYTATIGPLAAVGLEHNLFQKAKAIGAAEERQRTGNTGPGELKTDFGELKS